MEIHGGSTAPAPLSPPFKQFVSSNCRLITTAETDEGSTAPAPAPASRQVLPMITIPPRSSFETLFTGGPGPGSGFSTGPMTLVSNFFSDHYSDVDCQSFSQLLAGAMASPASQIPPVSMLDDCSSSKQTDFDKNLGGFKQNRPMDLVIAQSPTGFMFSSVFSPSGLLNCPGFFSPLQIHKNVCASTLGKSLASRGQ